MKFVIFACCCCCLQGGAPGFRRSRQASRMRSARTCQADGRGSACHSRVLSWDGPARIPGRVQGRGSACHSRVLSPAPATAWHGACTGIMIFSMPSGRRAPAVGWECPERGTVWGGGGGRIQARRIQAGRAGAEGTRRQAGRRRIQAGRAGAEGTRRQAGRQARCRVRHERPCPNRVLSDQRASGRLPIP